MNSEILIALSTFAFVTSITPGPNNLMLMASGANFGFARSIPHMLGIGIGFVAMIVLIGVGLGQVFDAYPFMRKVLRVLSVAYLLYLAWMIATAAPPEASPEVGTPLSFLQAALFQWVNPKAWSMAMTSLAAYAPSQQFRDVAAVAIMFGLINLPCVSSWAFFGVQMRRFFGAPRRLRMFNIVMAALLVATLYPVLRV